MGSLATWSLANDPGSVNPSAYRIHPELIGELVREGTVRWVEVSVGVQYRVIREVVGLNCFYSTRGES